MLSEESIDVPINDIKLEAVATLVASARRQPACDVKSGGPSCIPKYCAMQMQIPLCMRLSVVCNPQWQASLPDCAVKSDGPICTFAQGDVRLLACNLGCVACILCCWCNFG